MIAGKRVRAACGGRAQHPPQQREPAQFPAGRRLPAHPYAGAPTGKIAPLPLSPIKELDMAGWHAHDRDSLRGAPFSFCTPEKLVTSCGPLRSCSCGSMSC